MLTTIKLNKEIISSISKCFLWGSIQLEPPWFSSSMYVSFHVKADLFSSFYWSFPGSNISDFLSVLIILSRNSNTSLKNSTTSLKIWNPTTKYTASLKIWIQQRIHCILIYQTLGQFLKVYGRFRWSNPILFSTRGYKELRMVLPSLHGAISDLPWRKYWDLPGLGSDSLNGKNIINMCHFIIYVEIKTYNHGRFSRADNRHYTNMWYVHHWKDNLLGAPLPQIRLHKYYKITTPGAMTCWDRFFLLPITRFLHNAFTWLIIDIK